MSPEALPSFLERSFSSGLILTVVAISATVKAFHWLKKNDGFRAATPPHHKKNRRSILFKVTLFKASTQLQPSKKNI
ncbi:hypothetical protein F3J24_17310 [Comamonas sp. Tr-654]|uniref:hypothetical protein n=1 Tax=Comamonas sp. Tr-654 TaxID=2608341 RepID=UPI0014206E8D|nr:hypothetical protein [Comamonas sp. Tr-654]NIF85273.1 hypothetical protein [Comamonas sp. Tr-654]